MQSSLQPDPTDRTNDLLSQLITIVGNITISIADEGPNSSNEAGTGSTAIWVQALAYASLATSLLSAFGAVMGKQWLAHYKSTRFGRGSLEERCKTRHRKLVGLKVWYIEVILDALPTVLQVSLLFFGISLTADIWTLEPLLGIILLITTSLGFVFFMFTLVIGILSSNSPFESRFTNFLQRVASTVEHLIK